MLAGGEPEAMFRVKISLESANTRKVTPLSGPALSSSPMTPARDR